MLVDSNINDQFTGAHKGATLAIVSILEKVNGIFLCTCMNI